MDITSPAVVKAMRAPPSVPIMREKFIYWISPTFAKCEIYHSTPSPGSPTPEIPGSPEQAVASASMPTPQSQRRPRPQAGKSAATKQSLPLQQAGARGGLGAPPFPGTYPDPLCIITHGKRGGLNSHSEQVIAFCGGFARHAPILFFEGTDPELTRRVVTFRALSSFFSRATTLSGKSFGAGAAARAVMFSPVKQLVFFTYPLVSGLEVRDEELLMLEEGTDVLFIIGDGDPQAPEILLRKVRGRMRARSWWIRVVGADHELRYEGDTVNVDAISGVLGQLAARWSKGERDEEMTECIVEWNKTKERVEWSAWEALEPVPENGGFGDV